MTNWCQNRLTIEGSPEEIRVFARDCLSAHNELPIIDFEKILPMPPVLRGLHRAVVSKLGGAYPDELSSGVVGMEVIRRTPVASLRWYGSPESVLSHPRVKAFGIESYDDLHAWLLGNDPATLELGRRCLAALDACGHFFEEDWVGEKWGCDPGRVDYHQSYLSDTGYVARFVSPYGAPEGIVRELARRHPGLTSRFVALEEGIDYTFLLTTENGIVKEERPAITDAFIDEVEGPGEVQDQLEGDRAFWEEPPTLRKQPLRHFRHWRNEAALKRALADYPVYNPPNQGIEVLMTEQQARGNYEFFLADKARRVEGLGRFLTTFGIALDFSERAKASLDSWLASYAAFLYVPESPPSFFTYNPGWVGPRQGLNIIFDLAIFIGDFAIHESPILRWDMDNRTEPGRTRRDEQFQRPVLNAGETLPYYDVIHATYDFSHSQCDASYWWKSPLFHYGSRSLARQFATKILRTIYLYARGDVETAQIESRQDWHAG
jgi:hypothetical protein